MPGENGQSGDGTQGGDQGAATNDATQTQAQAGEGSQAKPDRTFTQADVDRIVQDRVSRAVPADYQTAKDALDRENARKEGEKSDLQKAQDAAKASDEKATAADRRADEAARTAEIRIEAMKQGGDEELVALALATDATIMVKDGAVVGAKEAVEKLLERKPNLKVGANRTSGGEFGGKDETTVQEQITALEAKGDRESMAEARRLKIAQQIAAG